MTRFLLLTLLAAPLALTACSNDAPDPVEAAADALEPLGTTPVPSAAPAEPHMEDGVQVVEVEAGVTFSPDQIRLEAGVPARLVITRTAENTCITEVKVPAYDVGPVALPLGEPVAVEFTPTEAGDVSFTCGMDMVSGQIVVHPASS